MIIALSGLPRVGKDVATKHIQSCFPGTLSYAFAEPFKRALCEMFLWKMEDFDDDSKEAIDQYWGVSKRDMMEYIGTGIMRRDIRERFPLFDKLIGEEIWVKRLELFIKQNPNKDIVISDLRYMPEYKFLKSQNVILVEILRPNYKNLDYSKAYDIPKMKFDLSLRNDREGDIQSFKQKVYKLYNNIKGNN